MPATVTLSPSGSCDEVGNEILTRWPALARRDRMV